MNNPYAKKVHAAPLEPGEQGADPLKLKNAGDILQCLSELFQKKNLEYGDVYHTHGYVMDLLFPNGASLKSPHEHARYSLFNMLVLKLMRYARNFSDPSGPHADSLDDLAVYAAMLQEIDTNDSKHPKF